MKPYIVRARIADLGPAPGAMTLYVAMFETEAEALAAVRTTVGSNQLVEAVVGIATDEIVRIVGVEPGAVSTLP
jgi:hypothetical protein